MCSHKYSHTRNGPAESEELREVKLKLMDLRQEEAEAKAEYLAIMQYLT